MAESVPLPLDVLRLLQSMRDRERDKLELALSSEWHGHGALTSEERQQACRPNVIRLLSAYASAFFDLEAQKFVALKLGSSELARSLDELAGRVQVHMIPPQFKINSFFYLGDLHYDAAYRSRLVSAIEERVVFWKKGRVREKEECGSPRSILGEYCRTEKLTTKELAKKARVDVSVIYALKAGRKKCGSEALARIASIVGCEPPQLFPEE